MASNDTSGTSLQRFSASREGMVERLFARLLANYGALFADRWAGCNPEEVKAEWARRLDGMPAYRIGYALANLPKWPPTLPEFLAICSEAPARAVPSNVVAMPTLPSQAGMLPSAEERRALVAKMRALRMQRMPAPPDPEAERARQLAALQRMTTATAPSTTSPAQPASPSTSREAPTSTSGASSRATGESTAGRR